MKNSLRSNNFIPCLNIRSPGLNFFYEFLQVTKSTRQHLYGSFSQHSAISFLRFLPLRFRHIPAGKVNQKSAVSCCFFRFKEGRAPVFLAYDKSRQMQFSGYGFWRRPAGDSGDLERTEEKISPPGTDVNL